MDNEVNLTVLTIKELYDLGARGIIPAEYVDNEIMRRVKEELKQKYHYWQGTGKDKRWKVHYYVNGIRHEKKYVNEKQMILFLLSLEDGMTLQKALSFKQCYDRWMTLKTKMVDVNTINKYESEYRRHLEGSAFESTIITQITKEDIISFMIDRIKNPTRRGQPSNHSLCRRSAKQLWYTIKNCFDWAEEEKVIEINVTASIKANKEFLHLTEEHEREEERVIVTPADGILLNRQFEDDHSKKPDYIPTYAVELAKLTGMRAGEIVTLKWKDIIDIQGQGRYFYVHRRESKNKQTGEMRIKAQTKNKKDRFVPITPAIQTLLDSVSAIEEEKGWLSEWVFSDRDGRVTVSKLSSCLANKCKQAGVTKKGCYAYRRTVNSILRAKGLDAKSASSMMGNTVSVNDRYYTYDVTDGNLKREFLSEVNQNMS